MPSLEEVVRLLKTHLADSLESALEYLGKVLYADSTRYNDYIQIKSRFNNLQRELLLGLIDHEAFDISRNNICQAVILLADDLRQEDLQPQAAAAAPAADKRGEILYHVPDQMQLNHEEKCTVRLAWAIEQLLRDWEKTDVDVVKRIRMAEIMGVQLLNVDESNPFTIRTLSEQVQFLDLDDYTEWIFYVKPTRVGQFPLALRVTVIEVLHDKEYKKDIVLEEQILVTTEATPSVADAAFKTAAAGLVLGNNPDGNKLAAESQGRSGGGKAAEIEETAPPPEPQAPAPAPPPVEAPPNVPGPGVKRGISRMAALALTVAALAAVGVIFIVPIFREGGDWKEARQGHSVGSYRKYLDEHPEGPHANEAKAAIDSLSAPPAPPDTVSLPPQQSALPPSDQTVEEQAIPPAVSNSKAPTTKPTTKPVKPPVKANPPKKDTLKTSPPIKPQVPPPHKEGPPALRGQAAYFKMKAADLVSEDQQAVRLYFYQHNEFGETLLYFDCQGEVNLKPGMQVEFTPEKGSAVVASLKYVADIKPYSNRFTGYFFLKEEELKALAEGPRVKKLRFVLRPPASGPNPVVQSYSLSRHDGKELAKRAKEALEKLKAEK